ncbi:MAG TPA: pyridoxamine 5'-phosphate oxidase family protein [Methanotrichaceae archaeon]|nr:pyridoxamine 5'-phosphate oxidase family protein [Methanotrichaceae archaeon]
MPANLMEYFNKQPRIGTLSTSSKDGKVDVALMGSPRMVDEKTVIIALALNRTFANLQENPHAVYMIMELGKGIIDWKGIRVYLRMKDYETSGELLDTIRVQSSKFISEAAGSESVGEAAAKMLHAAVTFEVEEVRPLVDMGQGWENSI